MRYLFQCVFYLYPKLYIICVQIIYLYVCVAQLFELFQRKVRKYIYIYYYYETKT